jgi:hypothetical protein
MFYDISDGVSVQNHDRHQSNVNDVSRSSSREILERLRESLRKNDNRQNDERAKLLHDLGKSCKTMTTDQSCNIRMNDSMTSSSSSPLRSGVDASASLSRPGSSFFCPSRRDDDESRRYSFRPDHTSRNHQGIRNRSYNKHGSDDADKSDHSRRSRSVSINKKSELYPRIRITLPPKQTITPEKWAAKVSGWMRRENAKKQHIENMKKTKEQQELKQCTFRPVKSKMIHRWLSRLWLLQSLHQNHFLL